MYNQKLYRAIAAEYFRRKYRSIIIIYWITFIFFALLFGWLLPFSNWWLLVAFPIIGLLLVGGFVLVITRIMLRTIQPSLSSEQSSAVSVFVDKLLQVADNLQTPPIVILFYMLKDIMRPSNTTYIGSVIDDSRNLRPAFESLRSLFT